MEAIRARGEAFDKQVDDTNRMGGSIKIDRVNLEPGKDYTLILDGKSYPFAGEAGGVVHTATM
jgi:hypothetical protein